jgi:acetyl/propionyl-CoA carboxylase alpha subunit
MRNALEEYEIEGIETTIPLHKKILENQHFVEDQINTGFVQTRIGHMVFEREWRKGDIAALVAALSLSMRKTKPTFAVIPRKKNTASRWKFAKKQGFKSGAFKWSS